MLHNNTSQEKPVALMFFIIGMLKKLTIEQLCNHHCKEHVSVARLAQQHGLQNRFLDGCFTNLNFVKLTTSILISYFLWINEHSKANK